MATRQPGSSQHLFVSPAGRALPRWSKAFPLATVIEAGAAVKRPPVSALVWLHLDESVPALDQLSALRRVAGTAHIVVLSDHPNDEAALSLFAAGIRGYCNAHATAANLRQVASSVQAGGLWIGEALMQRLLASTQSALSRVPGGVMPSGSAGDAMADLLSALTEREREVARAVAKGFSNKEIARQMGITERTIKAHVGSIFQKLKARDRLHLALIVNGQRPA